MKKFYSSLVLILGIAQNSDAQLSLTKALNEPIVGDIVSRQAFDSTTAVPKATGSGLNWNFTSLVALTNTETSTYTTVASTPSAAIFPGATISENQGNGSYQHYKSTSTTFEVQGIQFSGAVINFSNTGILFTWPVNFGSSVNDQFGGSTTTGSVTTAIIGSVNASGSGTGTLVLPGGLVLTNCLQVLNTITFTLSSGTSTSAQTQKEYYYYHSSNKFPVLTVHYRTETVGTVTSMDFDAYINKTVVVGLTSQVIDNDVLIFPNPASEMINISFTNNSNQNVSIELSNMLGQPVRKENLGDGILIRANINVNDLLKGIYIMNLKIGQACSAKKVVIE